MCYTKSVGFMEFLMDCCIYDDILDTILSTDRKLLCFKLSKLDQILRADKTGFLRSGHILFWYNSLKQPILPTANIMY